MLKELWKEAPIPMKIVWTVSVLIGITASAVIVTILIKILMKLW